MLSYSLLDQPLASRKSSSEDCALRPPDKADGFMTLRYDHVLKPRPVVALKVSAGQMQLCDQIFHTSPLKRKREQMSAANLIYPSKGASYGCLCWLNFGHIPGSID